MCICDPLTGVVCALHQDLLRRVRVEGFDATARAAGWVPLAEVLAEVLAALRDDGALRAWYAARHPYACIDIGAGRFFAEYLADRLDAKETP